MAIYPKMSLSDLRTASRQRADMVNSTFVSDAELNSYINASYYELYDLLVQKYGNDYYMKEYSFQLQGNVSRYDLPEDFFKLLGVDLQISAGPDGYVSLRPFTLAERNRYSTANVQTWIGVTNLRYRISANKLWFTPSPQTGQTIRIWYVPRLSELVDTVTLTVNAQPVLGDFVSIGSTSITLTSNPTLTVNTPVAGDYISFAANPSILPNTPVLLQAAPVVLTVNNPIGTPSLQFNSTFLSAGIEWTIGPTDADTAISIANAINFAAITGIVATPNFNTVVLEQTATETVTLNSSSPGALDFSATSIALTWQLGVNNNASAVNLANAINSLGIDVTATSNANVISFQANSGPYTVSAANYSNPAVPGAASRLVWSSPTLVSGWSIGATVIDTASDLADAINAAAIPDVVAVANGATITLTQEALTTLALTVGNTLGTLGASTRLQFSASSLSPGSTVADGISGWLEYVVTDAAIKMLQKEESDTSVLQLQKAALIKRVEAAAENRDAGSPATIADVQWTNGTWPFGNGFGGGGGIP